MKKKRRRYIVTVAVGLSCLAPIFLAQGTSIGQNVARKDVMRAKLDHAHELIDALVAEDYDMLAKHAQRLSLLSLESSWKMLETADYARHSDDFRRAADLLTKTAKEENLDGATLAYFQLTLSCVNCHRHVRSVNR